jgi:hypothetical protein
VIIACGGGLIIISFFGCLGSWKEKKTLLFFFIFVGIIVSIVIIAFGAVLLYARKLSDDYLGSSTKCSSQFGSTDDAATKAVGALCLLYCPCKATDPYVIAYTSTSSDYYKNSTTGATSILTCNPCQQMSSLNTTAQNYLISWVQSNLGITVTATNCNIDSKTFQDKYFTSSMNTYIPLLTWIENSFQCSGLCNPQNLYMFSNINNGKPKNGCITELNNWAQTNFLMYGIIAIVLGVYMILVMIMSMTICCCKKKRHTDQV